MDGGVELGDVVVGCVRVEGRRVRIAHLRQRLRTELDELLEAAEGLLRVFPVGAVVVPFGLVNTGQEVRVLLLEQVELAVDQLVEAPGHRNGFVG